MAKVIARRPILYWAITFGVGLTLGMILVGPLSAAQGPPGGLGVSEVNLDGDGYIRVHEQGVADVNVIDGSVNADVAFPTSQSVDDGGSVLSVDDAGGTLTVDGTVNIGNLPSTSATQTGSTGNINMVIGDNPFASLAIPEDVIVTDVIANFRVFGGAGCRLVVTDGSTDYFDQDFGKDILLLNLTTGIEGPLTIALNASGTSGARCNTNVTWTGYSAP